jgi:hypothetical protein
MFAGVDHELLRHVATALVLLGQMARLGEAAAALRSRPARAAMLTIGPR